MSTAISKVGKYTVSHTPAIKQIVITKQGFLVPEVVKIYDYETAPESAKLLLEAVEWAKAN